MTLCSNAPNKNCLMRKTSTVHCPHLSDTKPENFVSTICGSLIVGIK